jgi:hypothetical protein
MSIALNHNKVDNFTLHNTSAPILFHEIVEVLDVIDCPLCEQALSSLVGGPLLVSIVNREHALPKFNATERVLL